MIKINLLKAYTGPSGTDSYSSGGMSERDQILLNVMKRMALLAIGPLALYFYENQNLPELQAQLQKIQSEAAEMNAFIDSKKDLTKEIKRYEADLEKMNQQMSFINKVSRDKINEYRLFQHLRESTPETVWIIRLEFRDNKLNLVIESDVFDDLEKFKARLSNVDFLANITPYDQQFKPDPFEIGVPTQLSFIKADVNTAVGGP